VQFVPGILDRKPVIVVGADDIGAGIARRLAREGARIAILDDDPDRAQAIATAIADEHGSAFSMPVDYRSIDAMAAAIAGG
jgi:NAD(P)-dependent dehydrogenase (short-subunit alcohol dehydrogenase family)